MFKKLFFSLILVLGLCVTPIYASETSYEITNENSSYVEYEISVDDVDVTIYEGDVEQVNRGTLNSFSWSVSVNSMVQSSYFTAKSGQSISINADFFPSNQNVNVGIIEPDGTMRYLLSMGSASHTFALDQTGVYRIFVRNRGTVSVTASGYYSVY